MQVEYRHFATWSSRHHELRSVIHLVLVQSNCFHTNTNALHPFTIDPSIEEVQTSRWLIEGHHVSGGMESHEGKIAAGFHLANLFAITA